MVVNPLFTKHEAKIDKMLAEAKAKIQVKNISVSECLHLVVCLQSTSFLQAQIAANRPAAEGDAMN